MDPVEGISLPVSQPQKDNINARDTALFERLDDEPAEASGLRG
jgi:hypothetical protein